ncbi:unnamed protein product [Discosporangium mesarthrocarpum]
MMAQQTQPTGLRPDYGISQGYAHWDHAKFHHLNQQITQLIQSCCRATPIYLNNLRFSKYHDFTLIEINLIHLHPIVKKRKKKTKIKKKKKNFSWPQVAFRLLQTQSFIQKLTGSKKLKYKIKRRKTYTKAIPRSVRSKMKFYTKYFNRNKYKYARAGLQLINCAFKGQASALSVASFICDQLRSKQKRRRNYDFLRFLKESLKAFGPKRKIQGIKIKIKGRYTHKPKGRSQIWKYQIGNLGLNQIQSPIDTAYKEAQTAYGSVGIKVWTRPTHKKKNVITTKKNKISKILQTQTITKGRKPNKKSGTKINTSNSGYGVKSS